MLRRSSTARYTLLACAIALAPVVGGAIVAAGVRNSTGSAGSGHGRLTAVTTVADPHTSVPPGGLPSPGSSPAGRGTAGGGPATGRPATAPSGAVPEQMPGPRVVTASGNPTLDALTAALTVRVDSVSTLVTAPAGFSFPYRVSVSVLYPDRQRITQDYVPSTGNRFLYNLPVDDGVRKIENVTISLLEYSTPNAATSHVMVPIAFEPRWNVTVTPLTFTLISDCDIIGSSEPVIFWGDERGDFESDLDMSAGDTETIPGFGRKLFDVTVADDIQEPVPSWYEDDSLDFVSRGTGSSPAVLPGTSYTKDFTSQPFQGGPCLGEFQYTVTINLITNLFL